MKKFFAASLGASLAFFFLVLFFNQERGFDVILMQIDGPRIYDVSIEFEGFQRFNFGDLRSNGSESGFATYNFHSGSWPERVRVSWKTRRDQEELEFATLSVPPPLVKRSGEDVELVIQFSSGKPRAISRVSYMDDFKSIYRYE